MDKLLNFFIVLVSIWALARGQDGPTIPAELEKVDLQFVIKEAYKLMDEYCPSGVEKCECLNAPGTFYDGPFNFDNDLLGGIFTLAGCNPGYCFCKGAPDVEVDIRQQIQKVIFDACPRGQMNRCLCEDTSKKIEFPFNILELYRCRPKKCKCNGSDRPVVLTGLGCPKGGVPRCPRLWNLECRNGDRIDPDYIKGYWSDYRETKCLCRDGVMPKCRDTGDYYQCSNGDYIDWSLGGSEDFQGCRMENFTIPEGSRCLRGQKCNIK